MRKSKRLQVYIALLCSMLGLSACAQEHARNEKWLQTAQGISQKTVLLNNESGTLPLKDLAQAQIAVVHLSAQHQQTIDSLAGKYAAISSFNALQYKDSIDLNNLEDTLKFYKPVLVFAKSVDMGMAKNQAFMRSLAKHKQVVLALMGPENALQFLDDFPFPILWSPDSSAVAAALMPQYIFGGMAVKGSLAQGFSKKYTKGAGFKTQSIRLKYTVPEALGINANALQEIDDIALEAIREKATPGAVVMVLKDGNVIYNKAFGNHQYQNAAADRVDDIFDLASLTKITATTPVVMRLVEQGSLNLDNSVGTYIPKARNSPMNNVKVRDVMLHQAGFIPFIPFHNFVQEGDYSRDSSAAFPTKVADNYYIKKGFFDNFMWPKMLYSPIKTPGQYVYSDISMYVMKDIVEHITETPMPKYLQANFYGPLGMQTAGFLPRLRFDKSRIVPTEDDQIFRKTLLEGYVHDQGAALAGGVAGHAGLFATANDLAIFYQMLLNQGSYGGQQYFKPETVNAFTRKQSEVSRRGLGFDRYDPKPDAKYPSDLASATTYGHTGYTGTCVWVDPERGYVYIFLSNRVNPSVSTKLLNLNIRSRIQDVIIKAIDQAKK